VAATGTGKREYDFSMISEDYNYLLTHGKKLFIQFQDVTFNPGYKAIPEYLMTEEFDGGCILSYNDEKIADGWVTNDGTHRFNSGLLY
jgi:hypothetical protein